MDQRIKKKIGFVFQQATPTFNFYLMNIPNKKPTKKILDLKKCLM